jgi:hypothetical protein
MIRGYNKRGSHVGIIASFTIFIMFLIGIYLVLDPVLRTQKDKQLVLEHLEVDLINEFSDNLTIVVMSSNEACLESPHDNQLGIVSGGYAIAKDEDGNIMPSTYAQRLTVETNSITPIWAYYSPIEFYNLTTTVESCNLATIDSMRASKEIFELKIIQGFNEFENLKTNLSVPVESQVSLLFEMANGTVLSAGEQNVSANVYSREIPIQYIDYYANNLAGKLIIKVW